MPPHPKFSGTQDSLPILYSFPHAIGAPGIGWTAWNQVSELVALGYRVHLVAASVAKPIPGLATLTTSLSLGKLRLPHRAIGRDRALRWHDLVASVAVERFQPGIVHTWPLSALRTLAVANRLGIPGVREAPNTHTRHAFEVVADESARLGLVPPGRSSHAFNEAHLAIEQREWHAATGILVPSEVVRQSFVNRGLAPAKLLTHRYGFRMESEFVPAYSRAAGPFTAIFLGRGEPRKGLHLALDAWLESSASAHGRFLVYGAIEPHYRALLADRLAHHSVQERGFTDAPLTALAEADVLLLPTLEEGSALITYEAQAVGCVPLVSSAAGARIEHGIHGLVHEPHDVRALAAQLEWLADDPQYLARLRHNSINHAPELTWAAAALELVEAYRSAVTLSQGGVRANAE